MSSTDIKIMASYSEMLSLTFVPKPRISVKIVIPHLTRS